MTRSSRGALRVARTLVVVVVLLAGLAVSAPWQQSVSGTGRVIAYAPLERQQVVQAPVAGRVAQFYVVEGDHVESGDPIALVADNDPLLLERLGLERDAVMSRLRASESSVEISEQRISSLDSSRLWQLTAADARVGMARDRLEGAQRYLEAADAEVLAAELNVERQRALAKDGLVSTRAVELSELADRTARADRARALTTISASKQEIKAFLSEEKRIGSDGDAAVEKARAELESARSERAKAEQELQKITVGVSRQESMVVKAPRAGTVLRLLVAPEAEILKSGDAIAVFVPDTAEPAVEIWLEGHDIPLVQTGRRARIQFEGWPAVQFVGWPSVAVGTFPGEVAFVDRTDDGQGRFRVVIIPDHEGHPWPAPNYLRQGVRVNAWVLLDEVTLGWELWRQFNGFPPSLKEEPDGDSDKARPGKKSKSPAKARKPKL